MHVLGKLTLASGPLPQNTADGRNAYTPPRLMFFYSSFRSLHSLFVGKRIAGLGKAAKPLPAHNPVVCTYLL